MTPHRSIAVVTPAAAEPITLSDAKAHLRVDHNDEDTLIDGLIAAARRYAEGYTRRALAAQVVDVFYDGFPACSPFDLPMPPVQSIDEVAYMAPSDDEETTLEADTYVVDTDAQPARVGLAASASWPATDDRIKTVRIRLTVGPGEGEGIPETIRQAMLLLIGHWYENREEVTLGERAAPVSTPRTVSALLAMETIYA